MSPSSRQRPADTAAGAPAPASAAPVRQLPHPEPHEIRLEAVLHALADPMRLCVVRTLATTDGAATCSQVALPVSPSTSTHHFRVLREAGVIEQRYQGTAKLNSLRRADLERLFPGLLHTVLDAMDRQQRDEPERDEPEGDGPEGAAGAGRG